MKYILVVILISFSFLSCSNAQNKVKMPDYWPQKIQELPIGLSIEYSSDTVYAINNTKDPEKSGAYQLLFSTSVRAIHQNLEIIEFGGFMWHQGKWVFFSIYDRPFNQEEFEKWYSSPTGILKKGIPYTDENNWLAKTNCLNGQTIRALWYFIAHNKQGEKFVGAKEIVGILSQKEK